MRIVHRQGEQISVGVLEPGYTSTTRGSPDAQLILVEVGIAHEHDAILSKPLDFGVYVVDIKPEARVRRYHDVLRLLDAEYRATDVKDQGKWRSLEQWEAQDILVEA